MLGYFKMSNFSDLTVGLKQLKRKCVLSWMYSRTKCRTSGIKAVYNYKNKDFVVT